MALTGTALFPALALAATSGAAALEALPRVERATETPLYAFALADAGPGSDAAAVLGQRLYVDRRLSSDGSVSCDGCHLTYQAFADNGHAEGVHHSPLHRAPPTLFNAMFNATQFWDGRVATLEQQARGPLLNPTEMGNASEAALVARLTEVEEYREAFPRVFGRALSFEDVIAALTAYERRLIGLDAPFDRFIAGDDRALDASAKRGWALFNGRGRCIGCHAYSPANPFFTDQRFHNLGIAAQRTDLRARARQLQALAPAALDRAALSGEDLAELGRFLVTEHPADIGGFKTPTLRNVAMTDPYMHDGSLATLWDVLDHYNKGGTPNPYLDGAIQRLGLSESEIEDLIAFLESLTSDQFSARERPRFYYQRKAAQRRRPERDPDAATGRRGDRGDALPAPVDRSPATLGAF